MIRSEHTGTGPLSSQLLQKAQQALKNDGKVDAQEMAEIKAELGENPSEDALKFVANLDQPSVISAVALVDSPIPLDERVKSALVGLESSSLASSEAVSESQIQQTVAQIRALPVEKIDALLVILEKARQKKTLTADEQRELSAAVPDKNLRGVVQSRLIREELTSELRRMQMREPDSYSGALIQLKGVVKELNTAPTPEKIQEFQGTSLEFFAKRPALLSPPLKAELKAAIADAGKLTVERPVLAMAVVPTIEEVVIDQRGFADLLLSAEGLSEEEREEFRATSDRIRASAVESVNVGNEEREALRAQKREKSQEILNQRSSRENIFGNLLRISENEGQRLSFEDGDMAGLTGLLHQQGADLGKLFNQAIRQEILGGETPPTSAVIDVDLKSQMSYVLGQILQNYENKDTMVQLATILEKLNPPAQALQANEIQLLRNLGLRFHDGKLHNLANKQEISGPELSQLKQLVKSIQRYHDPNDTELSAPHPSGNHLTNRDALKNAFDILAKSQAIKDEMVALAAEIARNDIEIQNRTRQHNQTQAEIGVAQQRQETLLAQTRVESDKQQLIQSLIQQIGTGRWDASLLAQLNSPENLARVNQLLAEYGLSIEMQNGSTPIFKRNGQNVNSDMFNQYLHAALQSQTDKLQALDQQLSENSAKLTQLQSQLQQERIELESMTQEQSNRIDVFKEKQEDLKKVQGEIETVAQDPVLPGVLPQGILDEEHRQNSDFLQQAQDFTSRTEDSLRGASESIRRGYLSAQLSQHLLQQTQDLQNQIRDLLKISEKMHQALKAQLDEELQALIAKANEAQALLNQTPRPDSRSLEQATQKWLEQVLKSTDQINTLLAQEQTSRQTERMQVSQQVEKIRRNAEYHLKQLNGFDTRRSEAVDEILRKSIQNFQADRPFLSRSLQKI